MSASAPIATRSWKCGAWTVTLTIPQGGPGKAAMCVVEWDPSMPERLTADELEQYRRGRNEALAAIARETGLSIAMAADL